MARIEIPVPAWKAQDMFFVGSSNDSIHRTKSFGGLPSPKHSVVGSTVSCFDHFQAGDHQITWLEMCQKSSLVLIAERYPDVLSTTLDPVVLFSPR